jgi:hypothetical protein
VNDIAGAPVDFMVGQFQVSDPLFKRELRLSFEDYAVYRVRIGDVPANLTYERGIMTSLDLAGFTLTGEVLNGNGVEPAQPDRRFDVDASKNVFGHLARDVFSSLRLGVFGYYGRSHGNNTTDATRMIGVDGTFDIGLFQINGQYVHLRDDEPTYTAGETEVKVNGGFGELIVRPPGSRFFGYGLYNLVSADRPLLDVGEGGGAQRLALRNDRGGARVRDREEHQGAPRDPVRSRAGSDTAVARRGARLLSDFRWSTMFGEP